MNAKQRWNYNAFKNRVQGKLHYKILHRSIRWKHWAGKRLLTQESCNKTIAEAIRNGKPFLAGRFGLTELGCVHAVEREQLEGSSVDTEREIAEFRKKIKELSGMFSNDEVSFRMFVEAYRQAAGTADVLGVWMPEDMREEYLLRTYCNHAQYTKGANLEPYYCEENPWSAALAGKKVLVVHPFADTISQQYGKHKEIWEDQSILPDFELHTLQAVQTIGDSVDERFATWFDALEYMKQEIAKIDFDVAIIGCGAYGLPLGAYVKELGKQAIHLGGATQVFFGIIGKRWETIPFFQERINDAWVRPSENEKPKGAGKVEEGCYW